MTTIYDTKFFGYLEKYDNEDFIAIIDSKYGWAVRDQAESILNSEPYEDQNDNALKNIEETARRKGEIELADSLKGWLERTED